MTDVANLGNLERVVEALLAPDAVTPERIRELIATFRSNPELQVSDVAAEQLARTLEERHDIRMSLGSSLHDRDFTPWLENALTDIDPYYWTRYRKLLEDKHFPKRVVATLDQDTHRTLNFLENPGKPGPWDRRGMVVGHVQSGKTANYTGLICKAADAGYRVIIVIAGIHNNLRNQTQKRIDEGFVGRDSARLLTRKEAKVIGVGKFDSRRFPVTFTNSVRDFSKAMATGVGVQLQNLKEPTVFVVKKNSSTLKNLIEWLREHNASRGGARIDEPMLLIDDEADNASINVSFKANEISRINGQIRELLRLFTRSCYVGYTATPFANIFIDPDTDDEMLGEDLFPRHFIVSLDPPSNYFGPEKVFGDPESDVLRPIRDNEDLLPVRHTIEHCVTGVPESLQEAIRCFILGRAIRLSRGEVAFHSSMLVNASRFTGVQSQIARETQRLLADLQAALRLSAALPRSAALRDPDLAALHRTWEREYSAVASSWDSVQSLLVAAVSPVKVVEVNSRSAGTLNYDDYSDSGLSVIAVGGFSLSRGLTLEGLMVSYFLRNSMMYDTLMQMGRWFGYRPGYEDLCRVWMPEEAMGWYAHIAESTEMLREEFRTMSAANATPEEFGLKVRAHPDTLIVTARNKMGTGEKVVVSIGLENSFVETTVLRSDRESVGANIRTGRALIATLQSTAKAEKVPAGTLFRCVPVLPVKDFLAAFRNHPGSLYSDPGLTTRYIATREEGELATWDVLIAGAAKGEGGESGSLGLTLVRQERTAGSKSVNDTLYIGNKQRVASRGVEKTGLSAEQAIAAETEYRTSSEAAGRTSGLNFPDRIYRRHRPRPLLVLHLLKIRRDPTDAPREEEVLAWSISFPETALPEKRVEYVVTTTWMREHFGADDADAEYVEEQGDV